MIHGRPLLIKNQNIIEKDLRILKNRYILTDKSSLNDNKRDLMHEARSKM